jgi:hypothetical protein
LWIKWTILGFLLIKCILKIRSLKLLIKIIIINLIINKVQGIERPSKMHLGRLLLSHKKTLIIKPFPNIAYISIVPHRWMQHRIIVQRHKLLTKKCNWMEGIRNVAELLLECWMVGLLGEFLLDLGDFLEQRVALCVWEVGELCYCFLFELKQFLYLTFWSAVCLLVVLVYFLEFI